MRSSKGAFLEGLGRQGPRDGPKASLLARKSKAWEKKISHVIVGAEQAIALTALPDRKKAALMQEVRASLNERRKTSQFGNLALDHVLQIKTGFKNSAEDYHSLKLKANV